MERRKFISILSSGSLIGLAGCSSIWKNQPNNSTSTEETPVGNNSTGTGSPVVDESVPQDMIELAQFAYNKHHKHAQERPYTASVESASSDSSQEISFVYNGEDKSFFTVETSESGSLTNTVEQYSAFGFVYTRVNPVQSDISYEKSSVDGGGQAYVYSGIKLIDELNNNGFTVMQPVEQADGVYRYSFEEHEEYQQVSGYIEIDFKRGVITEVELDASGVDGQYLLSIEFTFGGQDVSKPAWVEDMDN